VIENGRQRLNLAAPGTKAIGWATAELHGSGSLSRPRVPNKGPGYLKPAHLELEQSPAVRPYASLWRQWPDRVWGVRSSDGHLPTITIFCVDKRAIEIDTMACTLLIRSDFFLNGNLTLLISLIFRVMINHSAVVAPVAIASLNCMNSVHIENRP
jgi:hypothetical protein